MVLVMTIDILLVFHIHILILLFLLPRVKNIIVSVSIFNSKKICQHPINLLVNLK